MAAVQFSSWITLVHILKDKGKKMKEGHPIMKAAK